MIVIYTLLPYFYEYISPEYHLSTRIYYLIHYMRTVYNFDHFRKA